MTLAVKNGQSQAFPPPSPEDFEARFRKDDTIPEHRQLLDNQCISEMRLYIGALRSIVLEGRGVEGLSNQAANNTTIQLARNVLERCRRVSPELAAELEGMIAQAEAKNSTLGRIGETLENAATFVAPAGRVIEPVLRIFQPKLQ